MKEPTPTRRLDPRAMAVQARQEAPEPVRGPVAEPPRFTMVDDRVDSAPAPVLERVAPGLDPGATSAAVAEAFAAVEENPWQTMDTAPKDGTLIEVRDGVMAVWRVTRFRDPIARKWKVRAYWADPITRDEVPNVEQWRMLPGYVNPWNPVPA